MKPWEIALEVRDAKDRRARTKFFYPREATLNDVRYYTLELCRHLWRSSEGQNRPLLRGIASGFTVTLPLVLSGLRTTPNPSATVANKMVFTWRGLSRVNISVPSWNEELTRYRELDRRTIDAANQDVQALLELLNNPIERGFLHRTTDSRGYPLTPPSFIYSGSEMKWK